MKFHQVVLLGAATLAVAQPHNHVHRHPARHGSPLDRRDDAVTTTTVPGPIVTVYQLEGVDIPWSEVEEGLADGKYVLVGDVISTVMPASTTSSSSTSTSTISISSSSVEQAQFIEQKSSTSTTPTSTYVAPTTSTTPTPTPTPTTTSTTPEAAPASSTASSSSSSGSSSGSGVTATFPSGELDCSEFPSAYGAVAADWLGLGGWTGVQLVPGFEGLAAAAISYIETAISGSDNACVADSFCSYACPAGYQKSQWPSAQGSTGQSIGGLYCNSNGKLELSRPSYTTLCQEGAGGVNVQNTLSTNVAICRTDYPGTESETVALNVAAGDTQPICNPDASTYYTWEGSATSAQYYINPSGNGISTACKWGTSGTDLGNWAPVNMGVGKSIAGETFISLFQNAPTNPSGTLDFNIKITGGVSGDCEYKNGKYYTNNVETGTGCTVSVTGEALFVFS
ncbi:SUN-domain-containing protein [Mollisia scopiformis]|uniref:SUN-domain-containing protein n=1 Tax=Mollisia scopiformis TaxID=149040 RepID=A0A194XQM3_MOLSC|nr:SUN-domain-containing protein [Mollisia scopiformis]KUJ22466.1 SUN-domain-containing protein [Mollisia scopiformis]